MKSKHQATRSYPVHLPCVGLMALARLLPGVQQRLRVRHSRVVQQRAGRSPSGRTTMSTLELCQRHRRRYRHQLRRVGSTNPASQIPGEAGRVCSAQARTRNGAWLQLHIWNGHLHDAGGHLPRHPSTPSTRSRLLQTETLATETSRRSLGCDPNPVVAGTRFDFTSAINHIRPLLGSEQSQRAPRSPEHLRLRVQRQDPPGSPTGT